MRDAAVRCSRNGTVEAAAVLSKLNALRGPGHIAAGCIEVAYAALYADVRTSGQGRGLTTTVGGVGASAAIVSTACTGFQGTLADVVAACANRAICSAVQAALSVV